MTTPDPMAQALANWKQATEAYVEMWRKAFEQMGAIPGATEAQREAAATTVGTANTVREASRQTMQPMVELMGGVPLDEFRRLADQVQTILLRLDLVDDHLKRIEERLNNLDWGSKT